MDHTLPTFQELRRLLASARSLTARPQTFAVFVARRSGRRPSFTGHKATLAKVLRIKLDLLRLGVTRQTKEDSALELAQLALRRSLYLVGEMRRTERSSPEASAMLARSIIETALTGSFLALHRGDAAQRLIKKQSRPAKRIRDRFLGGDTLAALALLPEVSYLTGPLSSDLGTVKEAPDLASISAWLDGHPPFNRGSLATLLYEETYTPLSNFVEHPTPNALNRYTKTWLFGLRLPRLYAPAPAFSRKTLTHVALPSVAALASTLSTALGRNPRHFDDWALEAVSVDGYAWTASPARSLAVRGLGELVGLDRTWKLNLVGYAIRLLAVSDEMRNATEAEQLAAAVEVVDRARRPIRLAGTFLLGPSSRIRKRIATWLQSDDRAPALIADGAVTEDPQGLVSALGLAYAGLWPDDGASVEVILSRLKSDGPSRLHTGVLDQIVGTGFQWDIDTLTARLEEQARRWK